MEMAEGVGFEPTIPVSQDKRLAGARTRPLCDPSLPRWVSLIIDHCEERYKLRGWIVTVQTWVVN